MQAGMPAKIWAVFRKDLLIELRTKDSLNAMLFFGIVVLVVFHFALADASGSMRSMVPGVLWAAFAFSGTLGLNRIFAVEKENNCLEGLLMVPVDRGVIYLGKMLAVTLFMLVAECIIFVFCLVFFNLTVWEEIPWLSLIFFVGTLGFASAGTLLSAISINTRMRETLLPLILFPVVLPILINAVEATDVVLNRASNAGLKLPLTIMSVFTIIFATISYVLFEYVLED